MGYNHLVKGRLSRDLSLQGRLIVNATFVAALGVFLSLPAIAAPISAIAPDAAETLPAGPSGFATAQETPFDPPPEPSILPRPQSAGADELATVPSVGGLFHSRELELSITDEKDNVSLDPGVCVYPDYYLRVLSGGADDCAVVKPGEVEWSVFMLPVLALSGWMLLILAVTGLYQLYGRWRLRRWLRRSGLRYAKGSAVNPRRSPPRRTTRSRSRTGHRSRRYAG